LISNRRFDETLFARPWTVAGMWAKDDLNLSIEDMLSLASITAKYEFEGL
jgi:hypothetical protein